MNNKRQFVIVLLIILFCFRNIVVAQQLGGKVIMPGLRNPILTCKLYSSGPQQTTWFCATINSPDLRGAFLQILDSCMYYGLDKNKYRYYEIANTTSTDDTNAMRRNGLILTDAIISFCKDIWQGADVNRWISNDEVSGKYTAAGDSYLSDRIADIRSAADLHRVIISLEPNDGEYASLKKELKRQILSGDREKRAQLISSVNLYRWTRHFSFDKFILVNIPSATLRYYERNEQKLQMKVVVGKPATKSPRFSTWCNQVILYPYWNVPRDIGVKELLPLFKKSSPSLDRMNMQVIGKNGKVINRWSIDWSMYNRNNFPYSFRQCTGCDNALGVIKFNLTDPFDVYLHDTNFKLAFLKNARFLSHGCIRVEKPIELGNYLLNNKLDSNFLKACYKNQLPVPMKLTKNVPVFVLYMPAEVTADSIIYHKDIYRLFQ